MGGSVGLIIGSSDGGFGDDFFFNGFALVALVMMFFEWVCSGDDFFSMSLL